MAILKFKCAFALLLKTSACTAAPPATPASGMIHIDNALDKCLHTTKQTSNNEKNPLKNRTTKTKTRVFVGSNIEPENHAGQGTRPAWPYIKKEYMLQAIIFNACGAIGEDINPAAFSVG